jgi:hypothetical protein
MFMQMLEGPRAVVTDTFGRIQADDRHVDVVLLHVGDTLERFFPGWTMRDGNPPPFLVGFWRRIYAASCSFWAGVMPPMPMFGRSWL